MKKMIRSLSSELLILAVSTLVSVMYITISSASLKFQVDERSSSYLSLSNPVAESHIGDLYSTNECSSNTCGLTEKNTGLDAFVNYSKFKFQNTFSFVEARYSAIQLIVVPKALPSRCYLPSAASIPIALHRFII